MSTIICPVCGNEKKIFESTIKKGFGKFCSRQCFGISKRKHHIGIIDGMHIGLDACGYPNIPSIKKRVHVYVAEKIMKKTLPHGAQVHHVDGNKMNWANSNLVILQNASEHTNLHTKINLREKGINWKTHKWCFKCQSSKLLEDFYPGGRGFQGKSQMCRECNSKNLKKRRLKNPEKFREYNRKQRIRDIEAGL